MIRGDCYTALEPGLLGNTMQVSDHVESVVQAHWEEQGNVRP